MKMVMMLPDLHAAKIIVNGERPKFILTHPTIRFSDSTPISPTTETIVSMMDQDRMVSFMERLKYSLNIQKPPSLTWEKKRLPAPTDNTIRLGSTCMRVISGRMRPAAVR